MEFDELPFNTQCKIQGILYSKPMPGVLGRDACIEAAENWICRNNDDLTVEEWLKRANEAAF